jgi:hypothetical protein
MDLLYSVEPESRTKGVLNFVQGQVFKQSFYYTCDDINKLAAAVGDKHAHQVEKPVKYGYLETSILSKALPPALLERETICVKKNLSFHKLMYVHIQYVALVNVREVQQDSGLVLFNLAVLENDSDKLVASGEALVLTRENASDERALFRKGLRLTNH